jgi:hypothetical protein
MASGNTTGIEDLVKLRFTIMINSMKTFLIIFLILSTLGYMFVQWANKPKNVEALLKQRKTDSLNAVLASKKVEKTKPNPQISEDKGDSKASSDLIIDENFADNRFQSLKKHPESTSKIKDNTLVFSTLVQQKKSYSDILALTDGEYVDFIAEMGIELAGDAISLGIAFNFKESMKKTIFGEMKTWSSDAVYSGLQYMASELGGKIENERLVKRTEVFKSIPKQKIQIEKNNNRLKISINGQLVQDRLITKITHPKGKIGILAELSNSDSYPQSVIGTIKNFKVRPI